MAVFQRYVYALSFHADVSDRIRQKLSEKGGTENLLKIRDVVESLCQKMDIYDTAESSKELDKLNLQDFLKFHGAGDSALAAFATATRVMLGILFESLNIGTYKPLTLFRSRAFGDRRTLLPQLL
jgi:hypothetical protein